MTSGYNRGRVLLVHRYYAPDTPPYATILSRIASSLAAEGHEVMVMTAQPSYNRAAVDRAPTREVRDGVKIRRWSVLDDRASSPRKLVNLVWFCLRLAGAIREFRRADVVMAATTPPIAVALVCSILSRLGGARFIYHKQDVWPEVLEFQGGRATPLLRLLRAIDARTERRSGGVVVLSGDMAETVVARGLSPDLIRVVNNFDPWPLPNEPVSFEPDSTLDIVFAGNLGAFQGLEALVSLVDATVSNPRIRWHFFGEGSLQSRIEELALFASVEYYGHRPPAEVATFIATKADLGVVSLNPGVIRAAYPSKTMTYLRNSCPLLTLIEDDSELASLVRSRQIGIAGGVDAGPALAEQLATIAEDPGRLQDARIRARAAYDELFSVERQLKKWHELVAELVAA